MGNCLRGNRRRHDLLLNSCDGDEVTLGQGEPLVHQPVVWTAEVPLTMGQLQGRRDTFWDTAPVYDGRREIWDALRASVEAAEREEYDLAQAILSGANITLPTGQLSESYDELGNRYVIPTYCLNKPTNMQEPITDEEDHSLTQQSTTNSSPLLRQRQTVAVLEASSSSSKGAQLTAQSISFTIKVRLSTLPKDIRISVLTTDRIKDLKIKLQQLHNVDPQKITMLYSGRVLRNNTLIKHLNVPKGYVIQAIVL